LLTYAGNVAPEQHTAYGTPCASGPGQLLLLLLLLLLLPSLPLLLVLFCC